MTSSDEIFVRLRERYCLANGWITMGEVSPPRCPRRFDALSIMGWMSRGFEALGFEIKVSRADWLRELKDVAKAEPLVRLCTRWWICAPPGVVEEAELPEAWGLLVFHASRIVAARQAPRLSPEPWSPEMWRCMLLRLAGREATPAEVSRAREAAYKDGYDAGQREGKRGATRALEDLATLRRDVEAAEKATGVHLSNWMSYPSLGMAMRIIQGSRLPYLSEDLEKAAAALRALAELLQAPAMEAAE